MKILVTGANGYIGNVVVKTLCDLGVNVIATDIINSHIDSRAEFKKANIFDDRDDWFSFFGKPDVCLHMAWRDGFVHNSQTHLLDLSSHYAFLCKMLDGGLPQVACMGSMHEVGYYEGQLNENTPCNPTTLYAIAKNALRASLKAYCDFKGARYQWLRGYYIYGDDAFGSSVFCKIRRAAESGQKTFPFTSGKNQYDFIRVADLAKQIAACVTQKRITGIIDCCSGEARSLADQVEWYIKKNHLKIQLEYGKYPDRPYDSPCIYGNPNKIKEIMGDGWIDLFKDE